MENVFIGTDKKGNSSEILLKMLNRHGLITGATGTGKTITLQLIVEQLSQEGVPVVLSDVKGDLSGLATAGKPHEKVDERVSTNQLEDFAFKQCPVQFWDLYGERGLPLRTTVTEIGPLLLARILDLNETQTDVLDILFKHADEEGLLLIDLKDLESLLQQMNQSVKELQEEYGFISKSTLSAIQRRLIRLKGSDQFLGEPGIKLKHLMQRDLSGNGVVNIIDSTKLMHDQRLYSAFLMWMLSEIFEILRRSETLINQSSSSSLMRHTCYLMVLLSTSWKK